MQIASQIDFPKVRTFLESIARGSNSSKNSYEIGLKHLQRFLNTTSNGSINRNNNSSNDCHNHDIESILLALQSNKLNVYELLDSFVSYLVNMPHQLPIAPTSVTLYVYAVRSYLQYHDIDINPSKLRRRVKLPKLHREDERPIDASEIRNILLRKNLFSFSYTQMTAKNPFFEAISLLCLTGPLLYQFFLEGFYGYEIRS